MTCLHPGVEWLLDGTPILALAKNWRVLFKHAKVSGRTVSGETAK